MAKAKRKTKVTKPRESPSVQSVPKPAKHWPVLTAVLIIAVGIAGIVAARFWQANSERKAVLATVEKADLNGIEPQVANKIRSLRENVKKNLRSAAAWGILGMNLDAHDLKKECIPVYKVAASLDSSDFRWSYFPAIVLSEMGSPDALQLFEGALKIKPDYVPLLVRYGDALLRFGRPNPATDSYEKAINLDSKCSHAYVGLAQVAYNKGDLNASRDYLQKALAANPNHGEAYHTLTTVYRQLGDPNAAKKSEALETQMPEPTPLKDPVYAELIAEGESSLWYRFRGQQYVKKRLYDAAIHELQIALKLRPDAQSHEDLGLAFSSAGKLKEAADHYQAAIVLHPTAMNYHSLGLIYGKSGRYAEAEEAFKKAIAIKPDFAEAYFNLSVIYAKTNRYENTVETLKQAIQVKPDYANAHYHLALAYLSIGNQPSALQEYEILLKLDPSLAEKLRSRNAR